MTQKIEDNKEYDGSKTLRGKREKFAKELCKGDKNKTEAAKAAGYHDYKGIEKYAYKLSNIPEIKARISFLQAEQAKKWEITKESQARNILDLIERCKINEDNRTELSAWAELNSMFGFRESKQTTTVLSDRKPLSPEEQKIAERIAKEAQQNCTENYNTMYNKGDLADKSQDTPAILAEK